MAAENLGDVISSLTPKDFLRGKGLSPSSPFLAAVDEFIDQHPELLRRMAQ